MQLIWLKKGLIAAAWAEIHEDAQAGLIIGGAGRFVGISHS
jgi:hypothetical protein